MQLQRLFEIVYILLQRKKVTAKELAEHFEVSTRTIYRDLDTLSMAGIPLYTNKGHQGGIFLMENYVLQRSFFSKEEQQKLLAALQSYHVADKEDISALLNKLSGTFSTQLMNWIDVEFRGWDNDMAMDALFQQLQPAILEKQVLAFTYYNSYGQTSHRRVEPLQLLYKGNAWYLIAYCQKKSEQRYFKLNRMENVVTQKEHFERLLDTSSLSHQASACPYTLHLQLRFTQRVAYRVLDEFDQSCYTRQEDGSFLVEIDYPQGEWVYSYLLSYGPDVKVLAPEDIKQELCARMQKAFQQYQI